MVKMIFCLKRLPGIEPEEFSSYWRNNHAELFRTFAKSLRVTRYTQSHYYPHPLNAALRKTRHAPEAYDGVAEVWFDSLEELLAGLAGPEGRAAGEALYPGRASVHRSRQLAYLDCRRDRDRPRVSDQVSLSSLSRAV